MQIENPLSFITQYTSAIGDFRKEIATSVIEQYENSEYAEDILAVAIAYQWKGAAYRKISIQCYSKYIALAGGLTKINDWNIVSDYGKLLEREHRYQEAITCYRRLIEIDNGRNCADYTRILECCRLIDYKYAATAYDSIVGSDLFQRYKRCFEYWRASAYYKQAEYQKALEMYTKLLARTDGNNISLIIDISETYNKLKMYHESLQFLEKQRNSKFYKGPERNISFTYNLEKQICRINNIYRKHINFVK